MYEIITVDNNSATNEQDMKGWLMDRQAVQAKPEKRRQRMGIKAQHMDMQSSPGRTGNRRETRQFCTSKRMVARVSQQAKSKFLQLEP